MAAESSLVLYGNSIFLAGLKAELQGNPTLKPVSMEAGCEDMLDLIRAYCPRVMLFDLASEQPDFAVELLRQQPDLLLIGVDPSCNAALMLSSRLVRVLKFSDLVQVIEEHLLAR